MACRPCRDREVRAGLRTLALRHGSLCFTMSVKLDGHLSLELLSKADFGAEGSGSLIYFTAATGRSPENEPAPSAREDVGSVAFATR